MFQTVLLGRPFGIRTYVHWSFWLLLIFVGFQSLSLGIGPAIGAIILVCAVFGCVVLHELGHALMARRFGIRTNDIYLYPIGGVARLERMPESSVQELLIALAGPAVNVVIAFALFAILGFNEAVMPSEQVFSRVGIGLLEEIHVLATINVGLVLFNLVPAFPMDGGRVLRALLGFRFTYLQATEIAASVGKYMALFLGIYGLVNFNFLLMFLAFFVYAAGQQERVMVRLKYDPRFAQFRDPRAPAMGVWQTQARSAGSHDASRRNSAYPDSQIDVIDVTPRSES